MALRLRQHLLRIVGAVSTLLAIICLPACAQNLSPLQTSGTRYVDSTGKEVRLHGVDLGSWLVMEPWMCPMDNSGNYPDMYSMMQELDNRFGVAEEQSLIKTYQTSWLTTSDLDNIKSAGFNVVRVPVWWGDFFTLTSYGDPSGWRADAFDQLDWLVSNCASRGIYVVIDMHGVVGGQSDSMDTGQQNSNAYWTNSTYQAETAWMWQQIASHYAGNGTVAGYDLMNEPDNAPSTQAVWDAYNSLYNTVRSVDPNHIVFLEGTFGNWDWDMLPSPSTYGWTNVAYEMHEYQYAGTVGAVEGGAQNQVSDYDNHLSWNVPAYIGEFNDFDTGVSTWDYGVNLYNHNDISWSMWAYKAADGLLPDSWGFYDPTQWGWTPSIATDSAYWIAYDWQMWATSSIFALNTGISLPSIPFENGFYTLSPQCATGSVLDSGGGTTNDAPVQIWQGASNQNQTWRFTNVGGSFYKIQPYYGDGLALDVSGASTANGTRVDLWADNGTNAQQWSIDPNGEGTYTLVPLCSPASALDDTGFGTSNGNLMQIWQSVGDTAQKWTIANVQPVAPTTTATLSGSSGLSGAYDGDVQVTLSATDPNGPSYLAGTYYTVDGGSQQTYSAPFTVSGNGPHAVTYWSVDTLGDVETAHVQQFTIAAELASIAVSPHSIVGGAGTTATITLQEPAPDGGAVVTLSTSSSSATFASTSVTVPAGLTTATVALSSIPVASTTSVTLTAKCGVTHTCHLTLLALDVIGVKVLPTKVVGGSTATGTVTLNYPAALDTTVDLSADNALEAAVAQPSVVLLSGAYVDGPVTVPAGSASATFTVYTTPVASDIQSTITASLNDTSATSTITVKSPGLESILLSPGTVHSGGGTTVTATLESPAPAGGISVSLSYPSNGSLLDNPPSSIYIPGGATTGTATITAGTIAAASTVTVEISLGTTNHSATLTVKP